MVATTATSRAITQMPIALRDALGLARDDMGNLETGVVGGKHQVRAAPEGQSELELDLTGADVGHRGWVVQSCFHPVAVSDRQHLDRRCDRRTLVDDDLAGGAHERGTRRGTAPTAPDAV